MKVVGLMGRLLAKGNLRVLMVTLMKANSPMIWPAEEEYSKQGTQNSTGHGGMIFSTETARKNGPQEVSMKEAITKERNLGMGGMSGPTKVNIQETGEITQSLESGDWYGLTVGSMTVNGATT